MSEIEMGRVSSPQWIVSFDYREDEGPLTIGPFPTKEAAAEWLAQANPGNFEAGFDRITSPDDAAALPRLDPS